MSIRLTAVLSPFLLDYAGGKSLAMNTGEENSMDCLKRYCACSAVILIFAAWTFSCSGGEKTPAETVLSELMELLDSSWDRMDSPEVHRENMVAVKNAAWEAASERYHDWPRGTGFSMSAMPDHVFISVDVDGEKAEGEWKP